MCPKLKELWHQQAADLPSLRFRRWDSKCPGEITLPSIPRSRAFSYTNRTKPRSYSLLEVSQESLTNVGLSVLLHVSQSCRCRSGHSMSRKSMTSRAVEGKRTFPSSSPNSLQSLTANSLLRSNRPIPCIAHSPNLRSSISVELINWILS